MANIRNLDAPAPGSSCSQRALKLEMKNVGSTSLADGLCLSVLCSALLNGLRQLARAGFRNERHSGVCICECAQVDFSSPPKSTLEFRNIFPSLSWTD